MSDEDIINTIFEMLFRDNKEKIEISENIIKVSLKDNVKYFFENPESLKQFVLIIYISSMINLYL